jgi:catechol 2,3-dioxygenase-like lactoylglutathione lyase family enzyme
MPVHLRFDSLTLRSIAKGEVPDSNKSALVIDVLHGLGRQTAVLALALTSFFSSGTDAAEMLGAGMGLNHVSIVVHDLTAMVALFRDQLGFNANSWGRSAEGLENGGVEFSNHTYLEFLAVYDPQKAASSDEVAFLEHHEGAIGFGLETDSAQRAAKFLRSRNRREGGDHHQCGLCRAWGEVRGHLALSGDRFAKGDTRWPIPDRIQPRQPRRGCQGF